LALLDENFPADLDNARKLTNVVDPVDMTDETKSRGRQLFAMLNSWTQELAVASKMACGIRDQNCFEFWRLLWREMAPDNNSKRLIWRRSLLSPKFPAEETGYSAALQEWEADLDKYEAEYGPSKAISDEDKRTVVFTEAPTALKQHLSMHVGPFPRISLCLKWWCPICKQNRFGDHQPRMREPPHAQEIQMPWNQPCW